jgi:hypothetical protein
VVKSPDGSPWLHLTAAKIVFANLFGPTTAFALAKANNLANYQAWLVNPVGILRTSATIPILDLSPPEFSSEFHFSDPKTCSCQFGTHSCQFGILSYHWLFQLHASENIPAIFDSGIKKCDSTSGIKKWDSMHQCPSMHHQHSHSRYPIHNGIETSSLDPVIGTVVKVPIRQKWMMMMKISMVFILAPVSNPS